jgi:hypothetical protein
MLNKNIQQNEDYGNEVPLSVIFANKEFLGLKSEKVAHHLEDFIKLCELIPVKNMSENDLTENIVKNALLVEFGEDILKNAGIVETIKEAILADQKLKARIMVFADKYCSQKELDKTLIN